MSNVFGVDIDNLTSVFDNTESKAIEIEHNFKSQDIGESDHDFEAKKRK